MDHDRRKPLGGVEKTTYVESGGHPLTYDLVAGLRSELCAAIHFLRDDIKDFRDKDLLHCKACKEELSSQYIKKAFGKWPVSIIEVIVYLLVVGMLIGSQVIDVKEVIKFLN